MGLRSLPLFAGALLLPTHAHALTFVVNSTADTVDATPDCVCSTGGIGAVCTLRAAVMEANSCGSGTPHAITLPAGTYDLSIVGTAGDTQGDLDVTAAVTINGAGTSTTRVRAFPLISSASPDRVFQVTSSGDLTLNNLAVLDGDTSGDGGLVHNAGTFATKNVDFAKGRCDGKGGALYNTGDADLDDGDMRDNTAYDYGGGIYSSGTLKIWEFDIHDNDLTATPGWGGGIYGSSAGTMDVSFTTVRDHITATVGGGVANWGDATYYYTKFLDNQLVGTTGSGGGYGGYGDPVFEHCWFEGNTSNSSGGGAAFFADALIEHSTFVRNDAADYGGGIYSQTSSATVTITESAIYENTVGYDGAGVHVQGSTVTLDDSTVARNIATRDGGGLHHRSGTLTVHQVTVKDNSAGSTGGGFQGTLTASDSMFLRNTAGSSGPDCAGTLTSSDYNIVDNTSGCTWTPQTNDLTGPAYLGAWVPSPFAGQAHFPMTGGSPANGTGGDCTATDQLGTTRSGSCDRGAVEGP